MSMPLQLCGDGPPKACKCEDEEIMTGPDMLRNVSQYFGVGPLRSGLRVPIDPVCTRMAQ